MPRKPRNERPGAIHHVYARGNNKQDIFLDDEDRLLYLQILDSTIRDFGWRCLAYCQMRNHVHLIIETPDANLGHGMCKAHGSYAREANAGKKRINHLFGKRYGATTINGPEHLVFTTGYVLLNPVAAGFCAHPSDWRWSSHAALYGSPGLLTAFEPRHLLLKTAAAGVATASDFTPVLDRMQQERIEPGTT